MINRRGPLLLALAAGLWLVWQFVYILPQRPDPIISQFGFDGSPARSSSKAAFVTIITFVAVAMAASYLLIGQLHRLTDRFIGMPEKSYWLAPERRKASIDSLIAHVRWSMAMALAFTAAVSWLVLDASNARPPRLSPTFIWLLGAYVALTLLGLVHLLWRFRKPPGR